MKFKDTALHFAFWKISDEFKRDCWYITFLKTPVFVLFLVIGVPVAIVVDFIDTLRG